MATENRNEWIIRIGNGSSEILESDYETGMSRITTRLNGLFETFRITVLRLLKRAWDIWGIDDPRKVFHCVKVGVALTLVSLLYYVRPLYDSFGGNALWAIMTVVVVFEYTVGGTLYKCLNRICATSLAGFLALGVHWVAEQSGHRVEPFIMGISLFIIASATTFSRFIPHVKARYDYGCTIFILTYGLVLVSGYRVEKLMDLAVERLSTIIIGTCLCIVISVLVCPVWAGMEFHLLIIRNMEKLANSLDLCVATYFSEGDKESEKKLEDYKCVINSKAYEETMADFARWEPPHGQFGYRYPWKNYTILGSSSRSCAYCIDTLVSCLDGRSQVSKTTRKRFSASCLSLSSSSSNVLRELSTTLSSRTRSAQIDLAIMKMENAVQELQNELHATYNTTTPLMDIIPLVSFISLLLKITSRIGGIVKIVEEFATLAEFEQAEEEMELQSS